MVALAWNLVVADGLAILLLYALLRQVLGLGQQLTMTD